MKIPVLPAVVLLSLALHSVQGAALGSPKVSEETTIGNYEEGSELKGLRSATPDAQ
uniref:Uncharacterized protein n=1 Tax=Castor canadensis TaxID=51338 RepID=A0A8C0WC80_CASCN